MITTDAGEWHARDVPLFVIARRSVLVACNNLLPLAFSFPQEKLSPRASRLGERCVPCGGAPDTGESSVEDLGPVCRGTGRRETCRGDGRRARVSAAADGRDGRLRRGGGGGVAAGGRGGTGPVRDGSKYGKAFPGGGRDAGVEAVQVRDERSPDERGGRAPVGRVEGGVPLLLRLREVPPVGGPGPRPARQVGLQAGVVRLEAADALRALAEAVAASEQDRRHPVLEDGRDEGVPRGEVVDGLHEHVRCGEGRLFLRFLVLGRAEWGSAGVAEMAGIDNFARLLGLSAGTGSDSSVEPTAQVKEHTLVSKTIGKLSSDAAQR